MATSQSGSRASSKASRYYSSVSLTSGALGAGSAVLDMRDMSSGSVTASSTNAATALVFFASLDSSTGPYRPVYTSTGGALGATIAALRCTALPAGALACKWVRLQVDTAGTYSVYLKG